MPAARRAAITGAPGAGKSTLLGELARRGQITVPEVARRILKNAGGMVLREEDSLGFAEAMLEAQIRAWEVPHSSGPIIYDRGFPDIVGFLRAEELPVPMAIDRACHDFRFDGPVFRAPPWRADLCARRGTNSGLAASHGQRRCCQRCVARLWLRADRFAAAVTSRAGRVHPCKLMMLSFSRASPPSAPRPCSLP